MSPRFFRTIYMVLLLLLVPLAWFAAKFDLYDIDGDAVSYMDIADLIRQHRWEGVVNAYWHPLYPALLALSQTIAHSTRMTELSAYYALNFFLFFFQIAALLLFVRALLKLRSVMSPGVPRLFGFWQMALLATSLLVIAVERELSLGKVRTDSLLQALILLGLAMLMESLAAATFTGAASAAALMGLFFGLAYLTKSFAFVLTFLCVAVLVAFAALLQKKAFSRVAATGGVAVVVFAIVAGPYVMALSHQKHRLTFGDSGSLNYVWYVSGTEKMHLEPWMTRDFGSADVHLLHPEKQLLANPGVYSYKALPFGTYPPWFDATYWNDRIVPKFSPSRLLVRDARNVVLILRYVVNHPEPLLLLLVLLIVGARLRGAEGVSRWRSPQTFAWPAILIGIAIWAIYTTVNVEERYVTVAYLAIVLGIFAALRPSAEQRVVETRVEVAAAVLLIFSFLCVGELGREDVLKRRDESVAGRVPAWRQPDEFGAAEGLAALGVHAGDEIACIGVRACVVDMYWARLAGVRIVTEVYRPQAGRLIDQLDAMPNRDQVVETVRQEGARVLVGQFDPGEMNSTHPAALGWVRLGGTDFYALPLNLTK